MLRLLHTPGHTPGHLSTLISSGDERALICGDVAVHPAQVCHPKWNVMFDMDGETARTTRATILDSVEAEGMTVAERHFRSLGSDTWSGWRAGTTGDRSRFRTAEPRTGAARAPCLLLRH
jgi:glyoxylase-like metal-dependent hydrolase (beta-lactamase superfamily II)